MEFRCKGTTFSGMKAKFMQIVLPCHHLQASSGMSSPRRKVGKGLGSMLDEAVLYGSTL